MAGTGICAADLCTDSLYKPYLPLHPKHSFCQGKPELLIMGILKLYGDSSVMSYRLRIRSKRMIAYYIDSLPIILIKLSSLKTLS